ACALTHPDAVGPVSSMPWSASIRLHVDAMVAAQARRERLAHPELIEAGAGQPARGREPAVLVVADSSGDEVGRDEDLHRYPGRVVGEHAVGAVPGDGCGGGVGGLEAACMRNLRVEAAVAEPCEIPVRR